MAPDQSALLEVLEALEAAQIDDRIRSAATTVHQALIEAELTPVIGVGPHEHVTQGTANEDRLDGRRRADICITGPIAALRFSSPHSLEDGVVGMSWGEP